MASLFGSGNNGYYGGSPEELRRKRSLEKVKKVILSSQEPLTPYICRILFACMIGVTVVDLAVEVLRSTVGGQKMETEAFLLRLSWSAMVIWGFFAVILIILSMIQLIRNLKFGYEERIYRFKDELEPGEQLSDFDLVKIPESDIDKHALTLYSRVIPGKTFDRYRRYLFVSIAGLLIFTLLYLVLNIAF